MIRLYPEPFWELSSAALGTPGDQRWARRWFLARRRARALTRLSTTVEQMARPLLSVEDARAQMLDGLEPLPSQDVALDDALGRVVAAEVDIADDPAAVGQQRDGWFRGSIGRSSGRSRIARHRRGRCGRDGPGRASNLALLCAS